MAGSGRIYRRGLIYYIAYRWEGREYRESARSTNVTAAQRLLATRLAERQDQARSGTLTFADLAAWYLDDYVVRRLRTLDTARGRVAHLQATFGGWRATAITTEAIRTYQRTRRAAGAAAATVNRETSALSRMLQLALRGGRLIQRPVFPERLTEQGPRQGFFEHPEYQAVRRHLPPPYQDVLDFAYYSGWRKREILELRWREVDAAGGVVRLSPERSKTRVGRVLPISAPIAAVLARRRAQRQPGDPLVFRRDAVTVRAWRRVWRAACTRAGVPGRLLHDCRRTAARNLVRAGVPERVAMQLTGRAGPSRGRRAMTQRRPPGDPSAPPAPARILPFEPRRPAAPEPRGTPAARRPPGLVATMSIDTRDLARLVARDLADEWVNGLIADHQRRAGLASPVEPARCGAPRRHPPHAPCRSTRRLENGRCRWHQGPYETPSA